MKMRDSFRYETVVAILIAVSDVFLVRKKSKEELGKFYREFGEGERRRKRLGFELASQTMFPGTDLLSRYESPTGAIERMLLGDFGINTEFLKSKGEIAFRYIATKCNDREEEGVVGYSEFVVTDYYTVTLPCKINIKINPHSVWQSGSGRWVDKAQARESISAMVRRWLPFQVDELFYVRTKNSK